MVKLLPPPQTGHNNSCVSYCNSFIWLNDVKLCTDTAKALLLGLVSNLRPKSCLYGKFLPSCSCIYFPCYFKHHTDDGVREKNAGKVLFHDSRFNKNACSFLIYFYLFHCLLFLFLPVVQVNCCTGFPAKETDN